LHFHGAVPISLAQSAIGKNILSAASKVDAVFVHTDEFAGNLRYAFTQVPSLRVPEIHRFDLGIDQRFIDRSLGTITAGNYASTIPGFKSMDDKQREFIHEVFRTQGSIPHRYISLDRIDPTKGTVNVFRAVDGFLQEQLERFGDLPTLRRNFRFFFLLEEPFDNPPDHYHLKDRYIAFAKKLIAQVGGRYPGIVVTAPSITGRQRIVLPAPMRGCHGIAGGSIEGCNLAIMEIAYANNDEPTTIICGKGAGIVKQALRDGVEDSVLFPPAGDISSFARAFSSIVTRTPDELRGIKTRFLDYIKKRRPGIF